MSNLNHVTLTGNLTKNIEIRNTQNGTTVGLFSLANNESYKDSTTGEWSDRPNYFTCVMYGDRANNLAPYLTKGSKIGIDGHLRFKSWEAKDGSTRSKIDVIVNSLELLNVKGNDTSPSETEPTPEVEDLFPEDVPF